MADFTQEERCLLNSVLPNLATALRTPLNNLHLAAERMASRSAPTGEEDAIARQSYYRLLRLVNNLSMAPELASDTPFQTRNLELVVWLDELCRQMASIACEIGVTLNFVCRERYLIAAVHPEYLERLVWNLVSNALKYTPPGGTVTVALERRGRLVVLSVGDTGCGIPPEQVESLFSRWKENLWLDPMTHGLGLGLPICRRIAQGHGGRLLLESRDGQGTLVTVALPHMRADGDAVNQPQTDYAGGFSHVMMELSDALPYRAFTGCNLD